MSSSFRTLTAGLSAAALAAVLAACGGKAIETSDSAAGGTPASGAAGAVKTGPGVTSSSIALGVLTDVSGVFAALGIPLTQAHELFWDKQNAKGGVCGRKVELIVKDHGYDPQKAVVQYRELATKIAALQDLLGSPMTAALLPSLGRDRMPSVLTSWASALLENDFVIEVGAPYEVEMINALEHLKAEGKLKAGSKVGHIYFEGEAGEASLAGSKYWASQNGATIVEQKIQPTDEDMSGQIAALKRAKVDAIAVLSGPKQLASAAGIASASGFDVPIVGNNPTFDPALMKSPAAKALKANVIIAGPAAPFDSSDSGVEKVSAAYTKRFGAKTAKSAALLGYAQSKVMYSILKKACDDGDLTREGIIKASHSLSDVRTAGLTATGLDYSQVGEPPTRAVFLARPADVPGGLQALEGGPFESQAAKAWTVGGES